MELDYILKLCWVALVVTFTLIVIFAFIETIIKRIIARKKDKECNEILDQCIDELCKIILEEEANKKATKKKTKTVKKEKESK